LRTSDRSSAETTDTPPAQADIVERVDALANRIDAIERQLGKESPVEDGAESPAPLAKLAEALIGQLDERAAIPGERENPVICRVSFC